MKKVIPKFRTEGEEARFWDTHSPLDYPDEFTEVEEPFKFVPDLIKRLLGDVERGEDRDHQKM